MKTTAADLPGLTADRLLGGRVQLAQPSVGYRVAVDPVLLAAAVDAQAGETILDAGCGTGAAMLCLLARAPSCAAIGIERSAEVAAIATANLAANAQQQRASVLVADLADLPPALRQTSFDHVMTNPPYLPESEGTVSPTSAIGAAHVESLSLAGWIEACLRRLRPGGWLTLIHRADRVDEVCATLAGRTGGISLLPVWPKPESPRARRVLVRARKGSRGRARLLRGLTLHQSDGTYTAEATAILRDGAALAWA
jgi:tRNA1(Val) A37 N6-methylase TrmN6